MNKKFTLIELIVVIAILGILAGIIIPNTKDIKTESEQVALISSIKSIQTAIDIYSIENLNNLPTEKEPTIEIPEEIDFSKLYPKYLNDMPDEKYFYWVDVYHKVWVSKVDSPTSVLNNSGTLSWKEKDGATSYKVYEFTGLTSSKTEKNPTKELKIVKENSLSNLDPKKIYLVSSISSNGLESAPTGAGYMGYKTEVKTIEYIVKKNDSLFENTFNYNLDGFEGILMKEGNFEKTVISGKLTPTQTKTVNDKKISLTDSFLDSIPYNQSGYSGNLYKVGNSLKVVSSGEYYPYDTKTLSSYYCVGQFGSTPNSATLSRYTETREYNANMYVGTLYKTGKIVSELRDDGAYNHCMTYTGTVTREELDTRTYNYEQNYSGEVIKPEVDTRKYEYSQTYKGEVFKK